MYKFLKILFISAVCAQSLYSQSVINQGKPITEIFTDFHINLGDSSKTTGFGLNRAYFGYTFLPMNDFSATIIINVGSPDDLLKGSVHRRYAYFREASIGWKKERLSVSFGITSTRMFIFQQKFWGKRYIANTYQSMYGYGYVADLGIAADFKVSEIVEFDFTLV